LSQFAIDPGCVQDDEHEAVLVVGQVDGDEKVALFHDSLPVNLQQGAAVPDLVEGSIHVGFLDENDVAVVFMVVGLAG
jgi:hypothetical protein